MGGDRVGKVDGAYLSEFGKIFTAESREWVRYADGAFVSTAFTEMSMVRKREEMQRYDEK